MENRFDKEASTWDVKPNRLMMAEKFAAEIVKIIKGKNYKTALEYGTGTGNVSFTLKNSFEKITLADASQGMINEVQNKIAQNAVTHFYPLMLDLEKTNINASFDVIYTLMTMHHVKNVEKVVSEFSKILLPGGILIIGDLEKEDGDFHRYPENQEVHHGFDKELLDNVLKSNYLKMNSYNVFYNMERTHTGETKNYPLFILSALSNNQKI